jgi:hypothetical protein
VQGIPGVGIPAGGLIGQVITKASNIDFQTMWADQQGGGGDASSATIEALDYKVDMVNLGRNLLLNAMQLDCLADTDGINTELFDGEELAGLWDEKTQSIAIPSSTKDYTFQTKPFDLLAVPVQAMVSVRYEGDATIEILVSKDGGSTWYEMDNEELSNISIYDVSTPTNSLIAKITFSDADAVLKGFCLGVQI